MTIPSPALAAKPSASIYRHPGFLAFISARLMAVFATQIQAVVVAWQVYDLTRDPLALVPGRRLVIGGVVIEHSMGLLGHSDADVLLHAITDALLGAAGLGDIGTHFPDTDPTFRGADSSVLLAEAARRVRAAGYEIGNIDSTVVAQAPRWPGQSRRGRSP